MDFERPQRPNSRTGGMRIRHTNTDSSERRFSPRHVHQHARLRALHAGLWISAGLVAACSASPETTNDEGSVGVASEADSAVQATFHVAPWGFDGNPGTQSAPFLTIERARAAVAPLAASMTGDIAVVLRGGTYRLIQPLSLTAADSGTQGHAVIYQADPGEVPVVSGGVSITNFTPVPGSPIWRASVPAGFDTRQLYVDGERAERAGADVGALPSGVAIACSDVSHCTITTDPARPWTNLGDVELVYTSPTDPNVEWTESRCGVDGARSTAAGSTLSVVLRSFCGSVLPTRHPTRIENAYPLLTRPGQWYLDRSANLLYYMPRAGQSMASASVIAPVLETLVRAQGVSNLVFRGITFAHATWLGPSGPDGFVEVQANAFCSQAGTPSAGRCRGKGMATPPGNVWFTGAHNVRIERGIFTHLGAQGLVFDGASQDNAIIGNVVTDVSGSGIRIGDVVEGTDSPSTPLSARCARNAVVNNTIDRVAVEYHGGVGLQGGFASDTTFAHNEIANLSYSGISLGWNWNGHPTYAARSRIQGNKIHHVMGLLDDGANIYALGPQPGSILSDNWVFADQNRFGSIYLDASSTGWDVSRNLVTDTVTHVIFVQTFDCNAATGGDCIHASGNHGDGNWADKFDELGNHVNDNDVSFSVFSPGAPPLAAQSIMSAAGVQGGHQDVLLDAPVTLDFGGAWGFVNGTLAPNPATGGNSCPAGYTDTRVLGTPNIDWQVHLCTRRHQPGIDPLYDFGGMWGTVQSTTVDNPLTGARSCPIDFTDQPILGTLGLDRPLHVCYKPHVPGTKPRYGFGGAWGSVDGGHAVPNPATGAASCPSGYTATQVLGTTNVDWPLSFCWLDPTSWDFGGMWGYVNSTLVPNPATGAASCPSGYIATKLLGTTNVDWPVYLCSRRHQPGIDPVHDFGGMWGTVASTRVNNPLAGTPACPAGYADQPILGTLNVDWPLHVCYKSHVPGTTPEHGFGGAWGSVDGGNPVPNPATGAASCLAGYTAAQVLGTTNADWPVFFCSY